MRKLFLLFIAAVTMTLAACKGNDPEPAEFTFNIQTTSTSARVTITAADGDAFFYSNYVAKSIVNEAGGIKKYIQQALLQNSFDHLGLGKAKQVYTTGAPLTPSTNYIVFACYVEENEQGHAQIKGKVEVYEFQTLPEYTLPGVFSVSATKTVRFASANTNKILGKYGFFEKQYEYSNASTGNTIDMFPFEKLESITNQWTDFTLLTNGEWWYLFKERPNADALFAHATVANVRGLIILPDNWQTPEGINLKTSKQMGMTWDQTHRDYQASSDSFNGYAQNFFTVSDWWTLVYAGAVFLPAPEQNNSVDNQIGWYWSSSASSSIENNAHAFCFNPYRLSISAVSEYVSIQKFENCAVRLAREIK